MSRDIIIDRVIQKFKGRSDVGIKKYGVTLKDDDQPLHVWLTHLQEELMDAVNYIEKAKMVLGDEIEEAMLRRVNRFNDNISNIDVNDEEEL